MYLGVEDSGTLIFKCQVNRTANQTKFIKWQRLKPKKAEVIMLERNHTVCKWALSHAKERILGPTTLQWSIYSLVCAGAPVISPDVETPSALCRARRNQHFFSTDLTHSYFPCIFSPACGAFPCHGATPFLLLAALLGYWTSCGGFCRATGG